MHAVESQTSGTVPLWRRDTAPAVTSKDELPVPTVTPFRREDGAAIEEPQVSPPRDGNVGTQPTDLSRGILPASVTWVIVGTAVSLAGFMYQMNAKIDRVEVLLEAKEKHDKEIQQLLGEKVELQIHNAGLRTTAMQLTQRIEELQMQVKGKP